ncbi:MAG: hypothetical protein M1833_005581 [Piccolia ochrophora]|nr:MAG: hypothetical protein M1833_005581 [Piccolia ochrophora]
MAKTSPTLAMQSLWVVFVFVAIVSSQNVAPTNETGVPTDVSGLQIMLTPSGGGPTIMAPLEPLTPPTAPGERLMNPRGGGMRLTTAANSPDLGTDDIAYLSCDPSNYTGELDASEVFRDAVQRKPKAIVLYSTQAKFCNISGQSSDDGSLKIFTMTETSDASRFEDTLEEALPDVNQASIAQVMQPPTNSSNGTESGGGRSNVLGPSPTTAVAMIILYSITGVITALFLIIIITGAVRAHRHPERYGPRQSVMGRPRQSRAKGIARAMLETIPIVKFGENGNGNEVKPPAQDIEMAEDGQRRETSTDIVSNPDPSQQRASGEAPRQDGGHSSTEPDIVAPATSHAHDAQSASVIPTINASEKGKGLEAEPQDSAEEGLGCSICTEDFVKGEDVRVLPCDHKYHPACIDPWLLNVSGTCPLCRVDLRPQTSRTSNTSERGDSSSGDLPPPLGAERRIDSDQELGGAHFLQQHLGITAQSQPHERIAALRRLRDENREDGVDRRRNRLSGLFRNSWRRSSRVSTPEVQTPNNANETENENPMERLAVIPSQRGTDGERRT